MFFLNHVLKNYHDSIFYERPFNIPMQIYEKLLQNTEKNTTKFHSEKDFPRKFLMSANCFKLSKQ